MVGQHLKPLYSGVMIRLGNEITNTKNPHICYSKAVYPQKDLKQMIKISVFHYLTLLQNRCILLKSEDLRNSGRIISQNREQGGFNT